MARRPHPPTRGELADIARHVGLSLEPEELELYRDLMAGPLAVCQRIDELTDADCDLPAQRYPRAGWQRPAPADNPYNAWRVRGRVEGAASGPLAGLELAVKDSICVAGMPAMNGSAVLEGYVPDSDATVVTRLLDAGATIVGKTNCEDLCFAGHSQTCFNGPVLNPHRPTHATGGSSSGSAAVIAAGDVPMALGGDQGGSIRIPAAWSGVCGLKPSYGLVPFTGGMMIDMTLDHLGPMADSVEKIALMLTAMAGPDGLDPRQARLPADYVRDYRPALGAGVKGLKIGVVKEGFGQQVWPILGFGASDPRVDECVMAAVERLAGAGAEVCEVSIPMHFDAGAIFFAIILQGASDFMLDAAGGGSNWQGRYNPALMQAFAGGMARRADDLAFTVKSVMLAGEFLRRRYAGTHHAKAQNLRPQVCRAYSEPLQACDVLVMPTVPFTATPITGADAPIPEQAAMVHAMLGNTNPFNTTGQPAISVPCGMVDGLPVGMMIAGRLYDDYTVIRVAEAFERLGNWRDM